MLDSSKGLSTTCVTPPPIVSRQFFHTLIWPEALNNKHTNENKSLTSVEESYITKKRAKEMENEGEEKQVSFT